MANGLFNLKQVMQGIQQSAWIGQKPPSVEYLVVAGGGGTLSYGGGGGAGGLLTGSIPVATATSYTVTVGGGGSVGANNGTNSVFGPITATGGGFGSNGSTNGGSGGSGGGGGGLNDNRTTLGGQSTSGQGNAGGSHPADSGPSSGYQGTGGGGGVGSIGGTGITLVAGNGGIGAASSISGTVTAYAGGGGGSGYDAGGPVLAGVGGPGGGGNGGYGGAGSAGTQYTGGGGGGGTPGGSGFAGGSGIVIVSYPDVYAAAASSSGATVSTSGSGSISFNGSNQYLNYAAQTPFAFGTGDFTIELWAYPTGGLAATPSYIDFRGSSVASPAPVFYNDNGTLSYFVAGANRITASYSTLNAWVHLAIVRISGATKMYVNGTQVGSTYTDTNNYVVGTGGPYIAQNGAGGGYYTGYISNLRVVKGVGVYTGAFTPPTAPLTTTQSAGTNIAAITGTSTSLLLNSASGAYLADSSTNSYVATATGSPTWNQLSPIATGTGYKNRVYTWTSSGSITF